MQPTENSKAEVENQKVTDTSQRRDSTNNGHAETNCASLDDNDPGSGSMMKYEGDTEAVMHMKPTIQSENVEEKANNSNTLNIEEGNTSAEVVHSRNSNI